MRKLAEFTLIALLAFPALASADPMPASRRTDWTYTGVPGGIPNRTKALLGIAEAKALLGFEKGIRP